MLLLDRLPLRFSSQPAAEPAIVTFVTHGMARRHSLFSRSLFVTILDRVAPVRESVKFVQLITQGTIKSSLMSNICCF